MGSSHRLAREVRIRPAWRSESTATMTVAPSRRALPEVPGIGPDVDDPHGRVRERGPRPTFARFVAELRDRVAAHPEEHEAARALACIDFVEGATARCARGTCKPSDY